MRRRHASTLSPPSPHRGWRKEVSQCAWSGREADGGWATCQRTRAGCVARFFFSSPLVPFSLLRTTWHGMALRLPVRCGAKPSTQPGFMHACLFVFVLLSRLRLASASGVCVWEPTPDAARGRHDTITYTRSRVDRRAARQSVRVCVCVGTCTAAARSASSRGVGWLAALAALAGSWQLAAARRDSVRQTHVAPRRAAPNRTPL